MKRFCFFAIIALIFAACHENIEQRASREAKDYTERFCPTPVVNNTRTDSVASDHERRGFIYYCSFLNDYDNEATINAARQGLHDALKETLSGNPELKTYIDEGFSFTYVVRSASNPDKTLYQDTISFGTD